MGLIILAVRARLCLSVELYYLSACYFAWLDHVLSFASQLKKEEGAKIFLEDLRPDKMFNVKLSVLVGEIYTKYQMMYQILIIELRLKQY